MPKFLIDNPEKTLQFLASEGSYFQEKKLLLKELEGSNFEFIGKGSETIVVADKNGNLNEVIAINYNQISPEKQKAIFYIQRIFSTLFPHNFPKFHTAFGGDPKTQKIPYTIREKVKKISGKNTTQFPFENVKKAVSEMDLEADFDSESSNFIIGEDGGEYYVDTLHPTDLKNISWEKIKEYMSKNNFSQIDIDIVGKSLQRLSGLNKSTQK